MFERFTDRARAAVVQAEREALALGGQHLGTEHLLLGLCHDDASVGGRALSLLGLTYDDVRHRIAEAAPRNGTASSAHAPFSPRAKQLLEASLRIAQRQAHARIGTSDLVLALLGMDDSTALRVVEALGVDRTHARARVLDVAAKTMATSDVLPTSKVPSVPLELSPQAQQLLRRAARIGASYVARRYGAGTLAHRASSTVQIIRTLNADPKLPSTVERPALAPSGDADAASSVAPLSPAACSVCGTPSPACGTLYWLANSILICERCLGEARDEPHAPTS